jgi:hypothetical protein
VSVPSRRARVKQIGDFEKIMTKRTLEERITALEQTVAELVSESRGAPVAPDWRCAIGRFAGDAVMQEIDEEGRRLREADRQQAQS